MKKKFKNGVVLNGQFIPFLEQEIQHFLEMHQRNDALNPVNVKKNIDLKKDKPFKTKKEIKLIDELSISSVDETLSEEDFPENLPAYGAKKINLHGLELDYDSPITPRTKAFLNQHDLYVKKTQFNQYGLVKLAGNGINCPTQMTSNPSILKAELVTAFMETKSAEDLYRSKKHI
jgi:hypothetical protein